MTEICCSCGTETPLSALVDVNVARTHFPLPEYVCPACLPCRHADLGPCGGPSNGRECWDHKSVGRGI